MESIVPVVEKKQAPDEMAGRTLEMCNTLIVQLMEDEKSPAFNQPVDYEKLNLPQYPLIINEPMDLRTVKMNLGKNRSRKFKTLKEFASKVRLVFDNARTFNQSGSQIYNDADYMSRLFERKYLELQKALGLSKGYDPPKEFVPPPSLPIPPAVDAVDMSRKVKDPPVQKKKRRNPSTATTTRTQRPKKRKTETESEVMSVGRPSTPTSRHVASSERTALHEILSQNADNSLLMNQVLKIISPPNSANSQTETEIDVGSLPSAIIKKLQRVVKEFESSLKTPSTDIPNPSGMDTDEDDDNDPDYT
uniref:Bromo domain-containing protein n=1 Tax=Arcella intermedia TaxID=1963864 RepID=A0A6B2LBA2_9EUKA